AKVYFCHWYFLLVIFGSYFKPFLYIFQVPFHISLDIFYFKCINAVIIVFLFYVFIYFFILKGENYFLLYFIKCSDFCYYLYIFYFKCINAVIIVFSFYVIIYFFSAKGEN